MMYDSLVGFDARSVPFTCDEEYMQARKPSGFCRAAGRDAIRRLMVQSRPTDGDGFPSCGRIRL
jgi:hypothetical protein